MVDGECAGRESDRNDWSSKMSHALHCVHQFCPENSTMSIISVQRPSSVITVSIIFLRRTALYPSFLSNEQHCVNHFCPTNSTVSIISRDWTALSFWRMKSTNCLREIRPSLVVSISWGNRGVALVNEIYNNNNIPIYLHRSVTNKNLNLNYHTIDNNEKKNRWHWDIERPSSFKYWNTCTELKKSK